MFRFCMSLFRQGHASELVYPTCPLAGLQLFSNFSKSSLSRSVNQLITPKGSPELPATTLFAETTYCCAPKPGERGQLVGPERPPVEMPRWTRLPSRRIVCKQSPRLPGCRWRECSWLPMPATISHESPPSPLRKSDAGSTPHHKSFLSSPASSDQMFASARPLVFGNSGADFVSLNFLPRSVDTKTFMPKNALRLEANSRGDQRRVDGHTQPERPTQFTTTMSLRGLGHEQTLLGSNTKDDAICHVSASRDGGHARKDIAGVELRIELVRAV